MSTSPCTVHGMSIDPIPQHPMGSHMYHGTLRQAPHWSMDIPWDPTCTMGHWDRHLTGPWTSHGIPHVPWDTGTGTSLVHGHPMGSHMYHGTLGQAPHWSMDIPWDSTCAMGRLNRHLTCPRPPHGTKWTLEQAPHWANIFYGRSFDLEIFLYSVFGVQLLELNSVFVGEHSRKQLCERLEIWMIVFSPE